MTWFLDWSRYNDSILESNFNFRMSGTIDDENTTWWVLRLPFGMVWHGQKMAQQLTWPAVKRQRCPSTPIVYQNCWWNWSTLEQGYDVTKRNVNHRKYSPTDGAVNLYFYSIHETWLHHGPRCSRIVHCRDDPMFCFETKKDKRNERKKLGRKRACPLSRL